MAGIVTVSVDGRSHAVEAGLVSGNRLCELIGMGDDSVLVLVRDEGTSTPISASDVVLVRGGEKLATSDVAGDAAKGSPGIVTPEFNGARDVPVEGGKVAAEDLVKCDSEVLFGRLFATLGESADDGLDVEIPGGATIVVQAADSYFVVPHPEDAPGETAVDIEECTKHERRPPKWRRYRIRVDRDKFVVEKRLVSGGDVLALVDKLPGDWALNQKHRGGHRTRFEADEEIDLATVGVERFETVRRQAQQG